ncbi:hypothetical protein PR048_014685 [Dryococelus australis]|uniref:DUF4371 domain-containing protein n=1 Tax=Dryococelus australis TaxID=614101 RepID=A0ABQ9HEX1_9NEOP|nr:hypothetical protein PR048_014685 [Dryococelus australis]
MRTQSQMFSSLKLHTMMPFQMSSSLKLHMMQPMMSSGPYLLKLHIVMEVQSQISYPYCPNLLILSMSISHISHPIFDNGIKAEGNTISKIIATKITLAFISMCRVNNCTAFKAIITSALFLARQGLTFRANTSDEVDETSDISGKEQVSINIRSVDHETSNIDECFIGLYETASMTGESLFDVIKDAFLRLDLNLDKLRGQCYYGGANMAALQDSSKSIPLIRNYLQCVNDIGVIVRNSPKRRAVFSKIATGHNLTSSGPPPLCPTRWTVREASLSGILNMYPAVLDFLDTLAYDRSGIGPKARGIPDQLSQGNRSDIAFDGVWNEVEQKIKEMDLLKPTLPRMRILPKRLEQAQNPAAEHKFESVKQYYRKIYYEFLDNIINGIEDSFEQPGFEKFLHLEKSLLLAPGSLNEPILTTISAFGIDMAKLKQEQEFIAQLIQTPKSVQDYVNGFKQMHPETKSIFP